MTSNVLLEHGTEFMRLKPVNIVQAALADLRLLARKEAGTAGDDEMYSFARQHVRKARSVAHLVALAYFEPHLVLRTNKHSTLVVYGDRERLRLALIEVLQG